VVPKTPLRGCINANKGIGKKRNNDLGVFGHLDTEDTVMLVAPPGIAVQEFNDPPGTQEKNE
jgi:hypothetical protein